MKKLTLTTKEKIKLIELIKVIEKSDWERFQSNDFYHWVKSTQVIDKEQWEMIQNVKIKLENSI